MTVLETPPFVVSQPQPPAVQLRLENAVLFPQEFQNIALLPLEPAEQRGDDHVQAEALAKSTGTKRRRNLRTLRARRASGFSTRKARSSSECRRFGDG
jgi:hypothetical protein